jgi:hypothetical protein
MQATLNTQQETIAQLNEQTGVQQSEWQRSATEFEQRIAKLTELETSARSELETQLQHAEQLSADLKEVQNSEVRDFCLL